MIFLKPEYLYMMLVPTLVLFYFIATNKSAVNRYFDDEVLEKLRFDNDALGKVGRNMLIFLALIAMIVALARPVVPKEDIKVAKKSIDMVVAFDLSSSMLADDLYPNRLEYAKSRFFEFVDSFKEANIAVIGFSSEAFLISPMTKDSATLKYLVDNLDINFITTKGTNLLIPIIKAKEFLKKSKEKILIIFSDGGDSKDFSKEIKAVVDANLTVYIYATATKKGSAIKTKNGVVLDKDGNIVITRLNEDIKELAFKSKGAFIQSRYADDSIKLMVKDIKEKFQTQKTDEIELKDYKELFYYPLAFAILMMLFAFSSLPKRTTLVLVLLVLSSPKLEAKMFDFFDIESANRSYKSGDYKEAIRYYKEVVKSNKSPNSIYDLANAYYKNREFKKALKAFKNVSTLDTNLKYKTHFNMANTLFMLQRYKEALDEYERAKKLKVEDDLIYNIKLTKEMLKKEKQKRDKNSKKSDKDKQKSEDKKSNQKRDNKKSKEKKRKKDIEQNRKKEKKLSKKEQKRWQEYLEALKPKTKPLKLNVDGVKRREDENPW